MYSISIIWAETTQKLRHLCHFFFIISIDILSSHQVTSVFLLVDVVKTSACILFYSNKDTNTTKVTSKMLEK